MTPHTRYYLASIRYYLNSTHLYLPYTSYYFASSLQFCFGYCIFVYRSVIISFKGSIYSIVRYDRVVLYEASEAFVCFLGVIYCQYVYIFLFSPFHMQNIIGFCCKYSDFFINGQQKSPERGLLSRWSAKVTYFVLLRPCYICCMLRMLQPAGGRR